MNGGIPIRGPLPEKEYRFLLEERFKHVQSQIDMIVRILDEYEKRGWMSANPNAPEAQKEIRQLLEALHKTAR